MKHTFRLLLLFAAVISVFSISSCKDKFEDSIFDISAAQDYLDKSAYTFPLDTFCKVEYLEPYNLNFLYKFEDKGSDMNKNLTPAKYDKCVDLAVLSKYLWYDIYKNLAGANFLKSYSPRVIAVCGSKNYNASQGTETLGDASGGIKINLYNVNNLDVNDIDMMNQYFFKTMHHEFSHILDQTYTHPTKFNTISNSKYDASGWSTSSDSLKAGLGFVSTYASSAVSEDWAEVIANYVTRDTLSWQMLLGSASYDWEEIDTDLSSQEAFDSKYGKTYRDTIGVFKASDNGDNKIVRRCCKRDENGNVILVPNTKTVFTGSVEMESGSRWEIPSVDWKTVKVGDKLRITADVPGSAEGSTFCLVDGGDVVVAKDLKFESSIVTLSVEIPITSSMLSSILASKKPSLSIDGSGFTIKMVELEGTPGVQWLHESGVDGVAVIKQKVDIAREYMMENYKISLDKLRRQVQTHTYVTDSKGRFVIKDGKLVNKLLTIQSDGRTLIDNLRDNVNKYKALQK